MINRMEQAANNNLGFDPQRLFDDLTACEGYVRTIRQAYDPSVVALKQQAVELRARLAHLKATLAPPQVGHDDQQAVAR